MKSERMTSSISERTRRMMSVSWKNPSVSTGMTRDFKPLVVRRPVVHQPMRTVSPRPEGRQPAQLDGEQIDKTDDR
jgi:hypothetical protein